MTGICGHWRMDVTPALVKHTLGRDGSVSPTTDTIIIWMWISTGSGLSRAEFLASSLTCKVSSCIRGQSQRLLFGFGPPSACTTWRPVPFPFSPVAIWKGSEQRERCKLRSDTYKTSFQTGKTLWLCIFFFQGKTVDITLVLFRLWNPKLIPMKILGLGA